MPRPQDRLEALKHYLPEAKLEDLDIEMAGQRVQVVKKDKKVGGVLEFGIEMVTAADGSLAASHSENLFSETRNWQLKTRARTLKSWNWALHIVPRSLLLSQANTLI